MRKYSRQRELILNYLQNTRSHPTAEQIYDTLRRDHQSLSLSTVYRNLNLLAADGVIRRMDTGESEYRFDADLSIHSHFICQKCKRVKDVFQSLLNPEALEQSLGEDFSVREYTLYIYGLCDCCSKDSLPRFIK